MQAQFDLFGNIIAYIFTFSIQNRMKAFRAPPP